MTESNLPRRILVGFDSSPACTDALRMGLWLHRRTGAQIEALHAVDLPAPETVPGRPDEVLLQQAGWMEEAGRSLEDRVARVLEEMMADDLRVTDVLRVARGHPATVLIDRAREIDADLILLGPHQRRGWIDFGSTARSVLAHAPRSVWIQPGPPKEPRRILVATDLSKHAMCAVRMAIHMARTFESHLTILNAFTPTMQAVALTPGYGAAPMPPESLEAERKNAERCFQEAIEELNFEGIQYEPVFADGHAAESILARQADHDLIVMGSHGRTGIAGALLGNVAYRVIKSAHVPVLALRRPRPKA